MKVHIIQQWPSGIVVTVFANEAKATERVAELNAKSSYYGYSLASRKSEDFADPKALQAIVSLWPDPGMSAEIEPKYVGPNDGKMRAMLLKSALNIARKALGKPLYKETVDN